MTCELEVILCVLRNCIVFVTFELTEDPVFATDGHTYERSAIEGWLSNHKMGPKPVTDERHLTPFQPNFNSITTPF